MKPKVSIVKCNSYDTALVQEAVRKSLNLIGGISIYVKPGSRVLVKPNILMAIEPESGIDTHPEVVRAVITLLKEINCRVMVGDSPSAWAKQIDNVEEVYKVSGLTKVCREENVELVRFDKKRMRERFPLTTWLDNCDHVVSVPKFKTHELTLLTGAIKNLYGFVPGTFKAELHKNYFKQEDFAKILVDIYEEVKPSLTIIDGIVAIEGDGPGTSGKKRDLRLVFAGADCVALDTVMAAVMNVAPLFVPTTKEASVRGLGISDLNKIEIAGEKLESVVQRDFLLPQASRIKKIPLPVLVFLKRFVKLYPRVMLDKCVRCEACVEACPKDVIHLTKNSIVFDYTGCISCFCCQEVCPQAAIKVKKTILARMIGL